LISYSLIIGDLHVSYLFYPRYEDNPENEGKENEKKEAKENGQEVNSDAKKSQ